MNRKSRSLLLALLISVSAGSAVFAQGIEDLPSVGDSGDALLNDGSDSTVDNDSAFPRGNMRQGMGSFQGRGYSEPYCLEDDQLKYADETGIIIADVIVDSPADQAGLLRGDIIIAVDDVEIVVFPDITAALQGLSYGDNISLTVVRGGKELTVPLTLETRIGYPLIGIVGASSYGHMGRYSDEYGAMRDQMDQYRGRMDDYRNRMDGYRGNMPYFNNDEDSADEESESSEDDDEFWSGMNRKFGFGNGSMPMLDSIPEVVLDAIAEGNTAMIGNVIEGSPASAAGMSVPSVVIAVDGEPLTDGDLASAITAYDPGDTVELTVGTLEGIETVSVTLGDNDGTARLGVEYYPLTGDYGYMNMMPFDGYRQFDKGNGSRMPSLGIPDTRDN